MFLLCCFTLLLMTCSSGATVPTGLLCNTSRTGVAVRLTRSQQKTAFPSVPVVAQQIMAGFCGAEMAFANFLSKASQVCHFLQVPAHSTCLFGVFYFTSTSSLHPIWTHFFSLDKSSITCCSPSLPLQFVNALCFSLILAHTLPFVSQASNRSTELLTIIVPVHLRSTYLSRLKGNIHVNLCSQPLSCWCFTTAAMQGSASAFAIMGQCVLSLLVCLIKRLRAPEIPSPLLPQFNSSQEKRAVRKKKNPGLLVLFQRLLFATFQCWIFLLNFVCKNTTRALS